MPYEVFPTADGHIILAVGNDSQFASFCQAAGCAELAEEAALQDQCRQRIVHRGELIPLIAEIMRTRTKHEWIEALEAANVPCGPINNMKEVFEDPQVQHRAAARGHAASARAAPPRWCAARCASRKRRSSTASPRRRSASTTRKSSRDCSAAATRTWSGSRPRASSRMRRAAASGESSRWNDLLVDPIDPSGVALLRAKAEVVQCSEASFDGIRRDAAEVDAVITRSRLPDDFFDFAKNIKAVMIHGTGLDLVPLKAATERGIPVANIPGGNAQSVAEYCVHRDADARPKCL